MKLRDLYIPKDHLSPTSLADFKRCPFRYYCKCCHLWPATANITALDFGRAVNDAMPFIFAQDLPGAIRKATEIVDGDSLDAKGDSKRNTQRLADILDDLSKRHRPGACIYEPAFGCASSFDIPFVLDVGGHIPFVGIIDCLGRHRDTGNLWGVEFKTTGELGQRWNETFMLNTQIIGYYLGLQSLLPEKIEGFFLEGILVAKVSTDVNIKPISLKPHYLDAMQSLIRRTMNEIKICEETNTWPHDYTGCSTYSMFSCAGYTCDYYWLCQMENPDDALDLYFQREGREFSFDDYQKRTVELKALFGDR